MSLSNNRNQGWSSLCTPAKLYGIFSLVSVAGLLYNHQLVGAISQGLFSAIWIFVLNWFCSQGWSGLSWFLVLLPIVIAVILITAGVAVAIAEVPQQIQRAEREQRVRRQ